MNRLWGLLATAAALAVVIGVELVRTPAGDDAPLQPRAATAASPMSAPTIGHAADWVAAILTRPLFSPDRRPSADAVAAADHAGLPRLSGIAIGPSGRSAIFDADGSKPIVIAEGGRIGAYTVRSIDPGQVRVVGPNGAQTLTPSFGRGSARTAQASPLRAQLPR